MSLNKLIKRVFRISGNSELAAIITAELNRPLLAHPGDAEAYTRAFLTGGVFDIEARDNSDNGASSVGVTILGDINTAIIDITGALVAKETSVPCAASPVSYEAIKFEMSQLINSGTVTSIVARFHSGGGVASQMVDASDYIFSQRGKGVKLYAMVDDIAYSAAYGLASAFDEIWVTRTSGVGSIGVVARFEEISEANKAQGKTVEYLYAGDKKVFGNRDEPLSKDARADIMEEITDHYELFTTTVARNLGLPLATIVGTQAGTYTGQKAIDAGLAHKLGTFDDLIDTIEGNTKMSNLSKEDQKLREDERKTLQATIATQEAEVQATKDALSALDSTTEVDAVENVVDDADAKAKAKAKAEADAEVQATIDAKAKIEADAASRVAGIKAVIGAAGLDASVGADYIASDLTASEVRAEVLALTSNEDNEAVMSQIKTPIDQTKVANDKKQAGWGNALGVRN